MFYSLAHPELMKLLSAAEQLLSLTGDAVELCPNYGTSTHPQTEPQSDIESDADPGTAQLKEMAQ